MAEDNIVLSLDERIENNLKELYENEIVPLKKIIEFVEQYKKFKLFGAVELTELFKTKKEAEVKTEDVISTHGLPGFFAGDLFSLVGMACDNGLILFVKCYKFGMLLPDKINVLIVSGPFQSCSRGG